MEHGVDVQLVVDKELKLEAVYVLLVIHVVLDVLDQVLNHELVEGLSVRIFFAEFFCG